VRPVVEAGSIEQITKRKKEVQSLGLKRDGEESSNEREVEKNEA